MLRFFFFLDKSLSVDLGPDPIGTETEIPKITQRV